MAKRSAGEPENETLAPAAEMLKQLLLPGEITDLSQEIEKLSGYRRRTIEEVKNASGAETTKS